MSIASLPFAALIVIAFVLFHISTARGWRRAVLIGTSGAFLLSTGAPLAAMWPVVVFGTAAVLFVFLAARSPNRWPSVLLAGLFALFVVLKGYAPLPLPTSIMITVGISYILFRAVQVIYDIQEEAIAASDLDPLEVILFYFSFLTLLAGPIQRYQDFRNQLNTSEGMRIGDCDYPSVIARASFGLLKLVIIAPYVLARYNDALGLDIAALRLGLAASVFMLWIYVNFSAYMDIVISVGKIFGFTLPENFNRPDRSINFLDLWNRWHITLSRTFLTYVFNPLVRRILILWPGRALMAGAIAYLAVFFLIGCWHGPGGRFVLSGVVFGAAAAFTKVWQTARQRNLLPAVTLPVGKILSGGLGLGICAIALIPTWPLFISADDVVASFGSPALFVAAVFVAWGAGVCARLAGVVFDSLYFTLSRFAIDPLRIFRHPIVVGLMLVAVFASQINAAGEFSALVYYQRF